MFISNSRKFLFVHIQKSGGTSVTHALESTMDWDDLVLGSTALGRALQPIYAEKFQLSKHSTASQIRTVIGEDRWSRYFSFAFVRHPYSRAASLYTYIKRLATHHVKHRGSLRRKIAKRIYYFSEPTTDFFEWPATIAFLATSSFSEFIRHPALSDELAMQPQSDWTNDAEGKRIVSFVGKLESLKDDFQHVCEHLKIDSKLGHKNASEKKTTPWHEQYSGETDFDYVAKIFEKDFDDFGYNTEWRGITGEINAV